jgi:hypothetical protein
MVEMAATGTAGAGQPGESIDSLLTNAFAPVHKLALGLAFGLTAGMMVAGLTILHLTVLGPRGPHIGLLSQYFYGYDVSWSGAAIGFFWAFVMAFVAGWFLGFLKNLTTALWMFRIRAKAELSQPFLDHI